jgi:hypothetical protein
MSSVEDPGGTGAATETEPDRTPSEGQPQRPDETRTRESCPERWSRRIRAIRRRRLGRTR